MTKLLIAYLAGALTIAGAVFFANGHAAVMFFAGVSLVIIAIAAALWSPRRLRTVGTWMIRFAEFATPHATAPRQAPASIKRNRAAAPAPQLEDQRVIDIETGLNSLGLKGARAREAARKAIDDQQGGDFEAMFRRAIDYAI